MARSQRGAAHRYDVSASCAVKLADQVSRTGPVEPPGKAVLPVGGKVALHLAILLESAGAARDITMPNWPHVT